MAQLLSLCAGTAAPLFAQDGGERQSVMSAIRKRPVATLEQPRRWRVGPAGLDGDESAERRLHVPPLQAVYVYPFEHYAFWRSLARQAAREAPLMAGALGENLSFEGLTESEVWIGDTLTIGSVRLRVTRARQPCFKLDAHLGLRMASKMMVQSGFTGFYCAVLQAGDMGPGDAIEHSPGERSLTVLESHRLANKTPQQPLF